MTGLSSTPDELDTPHFWRRVHSAGQTQHGKVNDCQPENPTDFAQTYEIGKQGKQCRDVFLSWPISNVSPCQTIWSALVPRSVAKAAWKYASFRLNDRFASVLEKKDLGASLGYSQTGDET